MNTYPEKEKIAVVNRYLNGEAISKISQTTKISRTTIYSWIKERNNSFNILIKEKPLTSVICTIYKKNATNNKRLSKYCNARHIRRTHRYPKDMK